MSNVCSAHLQEVVVNIEHIQQKRGLQVGRLSTFLNEDFLRYCQTPLWELAFPRITDLIQSRTGFTPSYKLCPLALTTWLSWQRLQVHGLCTPVLSRVVALMTYHICGVYFLLKQQRPLICSSWIVTCCFQHHVTWTATRRSLTVLMHAGKRGGRVSADLELKRTSALN